MRRWLVLSALLALLVAPLAGAQQQGMMVPGTQIPLHKVEIYGVGGFAFTFSVEAYNGLVPGDLDADDTGWWGAGLDFWAGGGRVVTLLYRRQEATYTFDPYTAGQKQEIDKGAIEYFHIGAAQGVPQGKVFPYGTISLGATRFSADSARDDYWKFSIIPGLGAKFYASPRFGLRGQLDLPISFTSGGVGFGCGGAGCGTSFYGTGITQFDVGGGAFLMF